MANTERREVTGIPAERDRVKAVLTTSSAPRLDRAKEYSAYANIFSKLEMACGGWNMVPHNMVGIAVAGQVIKQQFGENLDIKAVTRGAHNEITNAIQQICKTRGFGGPKIDPIEVRKQIMKGMREQAKEWPTDSEIWNVIRELESQMN